ncbi:MAG: transposase [Phocaeicola vulgatus]|nr:transposase [Lachnospiraceae bacterium]MCI6833617.1 transposase [Phocaeicola vulgatus]
MYEKYLVPVPESKGKITIKKKNDTAYVLFEYGRVYNSEKKYNIPQRSIIGKLYADDPKKMYPNEKYQEYFPDTTIFEELPVAYRSCCLKIGSYIVIDKILREYDLPKMLGNCFDKNCGLFMDLVSYLIVDEENAGQYYPDYAFNHPLFSTDMKIYSDSTVSRFFSSMTTDQSIAFLDNWNKKRNRQQRIYLSYDSTNKNCQAGDVDIVEFGKAKDDKGTPIFNLAIAFDSTYKVPLFYEEYPGSINDVSQFTFMVDKVKEYRYKNIGFILDRGYFSKDNIRYIDSNNYEFIIMAKGCKPLVSALIKRVKNTFETDRSCSIRAYKVYGTTVQSKLYEDDEKDRYFHIYYNPAKQAAEREKLEQKLDRLKAFIDKNIGDDTQFGKTYQEYFDFNYDKNGRLLYYEEKSDVVSYELELCGYFCIITSEKMTTEKALILYKGRDISEKLFRNDKSFLGSKSMRVQSDEAVSAKIFIEFVALIVRNRIYNLLKEEMIKLETKRNHLTVPAAIRELEKIEMVRRNNGKYRLDHAITKTQKTILAAFGLDEEYVFSKALEISKMLEQSYSKADDQEDNENGTKEIDYED